MDCPDSSLVSAAEYMRKFTRLAADKRVPLCGTFDITRECNLSCVHCYAKGCNSSNAGAGGAQRLAAGRMARLLDECADAGCLYVLLTGGDPLMHPDFAGIYFKAKMNGMFVSVFTNGTNVKEEILNLFQDLPPRQIEVTVYGGTAETNDRITGVPGSFKRCLGGIEKMLERKLNVGLKTILMKENAGELDLIEDIAARYGLNFRFDACLFPRLDGDAAPLKLRMGAEAVVDKEFAREKIASEWSGLHERHGKVEQTDLLYWCGAGVTAFYVSPDGMLQPCMMVRSVTYNLADGDFKSGWRDIASRMSTKMLEEKSACRGCERRGVCGYCPGFFEMETGSENVPSQYLCEVGAGRLARILSAKKARIEE
ncbi:MAG: hypothetical protein C0404_01210 [Verrucomicrobia bacterium]|nr:hypothetical protein [Verrucomicrobiota bacterium]